MAPRKEAAAFEAIINKARERRKNQAFTTEFFQKTRQKRSATGALNDRSLENRVASVASSRKLANRIRKPGSAPSSSSSTATPSSASSSAPGTVNGPVTATFTVPRGPRHSTNASARYARKVAAAAAAVAPVQPKPATTTAPHPSSSYSYASVPATTLSSAAAPADLTIRGAASGPCYVIGSNFAPGTSAVDVQCAFEVEGGPILSCAIVSTRPVVVAEILFAERVGAERVVSMYHNQRADGRILQLYIRPSSGVYGAAPSATAPATVAAAAAPTSYADTRHAAPREPATRRGRRYAEDDGRLYY